MNVLCIIYIPVLDIELLKSSTSQILYYIQILTMYLLRSVFCRLYNSAKPQKHFVLNANFVARLKRFSFSKCL